MNILLILAFLLFVGLAILAQRKESTKGFSYTFFIIAAVIAAMTYPQLFTHIGDFATSKLIVPLLMLMMFCMGTAMRVEDFIGVIKMPKGVIVGIICQFTIMPFVGYGLTRIFQFPPEIAAGVILVGCSPSGLASNVMSYIAKANLALSLTLTACATILAPIITPFLMRLLANELVPIDFWSMFMSIVKIVIIPIIAGLIFNALTKNKLQWLKDLMPLLAQISIALVITIITALGRDSLLSIGIALVVVVVLHNFAGFFFGYVGSKLVGLDKQSCRTVALEVGMQNGGLASGIALEMGRVATMGLAPALFGPFMNVSGSSLATWWKERP